MVHAYDLDTDPTKYWKRANDKNVGYQWDNAEEEYAIKGLDNKAAKELHESIRDSHNGKPGNSLQIFNTVSPISITEDLNLQF